MRRARSLTPVGARCYCCNPHESGKTHARLHQRGDRPRARPLDERWWSLSREDANADVLGVARRHRLVAPGHATASFVARTRRFRTRFRGAVRTSPGRLPSHRSRSAPLSANQPPLSCFAFCMTLHDENAHRILPAPRGPRRVNEAVDEQAGGRAALHGYVRRRSPRDAFDGFLPLTSHERVHAHRVLFGFASLRSRLARALARVAACRANADTTRRRGAVSRRLPRRGIDA